MSKKINIGLDVSWKDITPGGIVTVPGSATDTITGEWRSQKPIWKEDVCKHCFLCFPVCPDSSIMVKDGKMTGIDMDHCKGCGVCANQCPFKAIEMIDEE